MKKEKEYIQDEIRKEFQLERMILFSDAVFAIVITLMALEIRVPEIHGPFNSDLVSHELTKLIPLMIAYVVSFFFIGLTWYQHLQVFSLLKDYDKGLVIRNLIMLFFIGLFPFSAALMVKLSRGFALPVVVYFSVIFAVKTAQLVLHHYILVKRPNLRINSSIKEEMMRFKKSRLSVILLAITFFMIMLSYQFIDDPEMEAFAWIWFIPFPIVLKYLRRRIK